MQSFVDRLLVNDPATTPSCHAATVVATERYVLVAWFGGTQEKAADTQIWVARRGVDAPVGVGFDTPRQITDEPEPVWNPVLAQHGTSLILWYRVGPSPSTWRSRLLLSPDGGVTWSEPQDLDTDLLGPIKNKPVRVGDHWLAPSSTEADGWRAVIERTHVDAPAGPGSVYLLSDPDNLGAIQPTILELFPSGNAPGTLIALCRTKAGVVARADSSDGGQTWSSLRPTALANPNSGIDGVMVDNVTAALVFNPTGTRNGQWGGRRSPLVIGTSDGALDDWRQRLVLEDDDGEFSYPSIIRDGDQLHVVYTWRRTHIAYWRISADFLLTMD